MPPAAVFAAVFVLALLGCIVAPFLPIAFGVLLIIAAAADVWSPDLRFYVRPVLRVLTGSSQGRVQLLLAVGLGSALIVIGSLGATVRGRWHTEWVQNRSRAQYAEESGSGVLERAREYLSRGDIEGAEFTLMGADAVDAAPEQRKQIDGLLEQIHRCGDLDWILETLIRLPRAEFEALEAGVSVPGALEFDERALTYRAVALARGQLDQARLARAGR